jgi:hypothetical protein
MKQEKAVNAILRDLKMMELVSEENAPEIRPYLMALWLVGWEVGRLESSVYREQMIGQYDKRGKLINTFRSIKTAEKETGFTSRTIRKSMQRGTPMRQGWTWKRLVKIRTPERQEVKSGVLP